MNHKCTLRLSIVQIIRIFVCLISFGIRQMLETNPLCFTKRTLLIIRSCKNLFRRSENRTCSRMIAIMESTTVEIYLLHFSQRIELRFFHIWRLIFQMTSIGVIQKCLNKDKIYDRCLALVLTDIYPLLSSTRVWVGQWNLQSTPRIFKVCNLFFQLNSSWQTFFGSEFFAPHIRVYNKQEKMHLLVSSPLCF